MELPPPGPKTITEDYNDFTALSQAVSGERDGWCEKFSNTYSSFLIGYITNHRRYQAKKDRILSVYGPEHISGVTETTGEDDVLNTVANLVFLEFVTSGALPLTERPAEDKPQDIEANIKYILQNRKVGKSARQQLLEFTDRWLEGATKPVSKKTPDGYIKKNFDRIRIHKKKARIDKNESFETKEVVARTAPSELTDEQMDDYLFTDSQRTYCRCLITRLKLKFARELQKPSPGFSQALLKKIVVGFASTVLFGMRYRLGDPLPRQWDTAVEAVLGRVEEFRDVKPSNPLAEDLKVLRSSNFTRFITSRVGDFDELKPGLIKWTWICKFMNVPIRAVNQIPALQYFSEEIQAMDRNNLLADYFKTQYAEAD